MISSCLLSLKGVKWMNFKVTDLLFVERRMPWVSRVLFERILLTIIVLEIKGIPDWLFKVANVIFCITGCFVGKDSQ